MVTTQRPWRLTDDEWTRVRDLFEEARPATRPRRGRPRHANTRRILEACLYHHFHSLARTYRSFGWSQLPRDLHVSPATANRRFREWSSSGVWTEFWLRLQDLRTRRTGPKARTVVRGGRSADVITATYRFLQEAYAFFNARVCGDELPQDTVILIEVLAARGLLRPPPRSRGRTNRPAVIAIGIESLASGADDVLETLLHEMAHLRNWQFHLPDTRGHYHNQHFRDTARLFGLECGARDVALGYMDARLGPGARALIRELRFDRPDFSFYERWR